MKAFVKETMKEDHDFLIKTSSRHHYNVNGVPIKSYSAPLQSSSPASTGAFLRLMIWLISFVSVTYLVYTLKLLSSPPCPSSFSSSSGDGGRGVDYLFSRLSTSQNLTFSQTHIPISLKKSTTASTATSDDEDSTSLRHVVFGIAASARLWNKRKDYIKLWWHPNEMRGVVWLDKPVKTRPSERNLLPRIRISGNTTNFAYTHKKGHRSAIRISRIVSETFRLNLPEVRWFVMGDDDTVFFADNLVGVLQNFDHRQYHYIGSHSESHLQNIYFSYGMAFGGGGFAISYPLAAALSKMQDRCIQRYPGLYGSDDRMQACMSELGVPLTQHAGFHQYDVYGNLFGLLAAHPVAPLVSLHHLDVVEPVFPNETRVGALGRLIGGPAKIDSASVMQQSTCYDADRKWTISVSWGFTVQIIKGVLSPREMEMPMRTFLNWYKRADYTAYAFNTRPVARSPCERPFVYYLRSATIDHQRNLTITNHGPGRLLGGGASNLKCQWKTEDPIKAIDMVVVHKRPDPSLWKRSPRRNCCRVLKEEGRKRTMTIDVSICKDGEISGI